MKKTVRAGLGAAVIAVCAMISVPTPVPFTLQTLGVFTVCLIYNFKTSFLSVITYIALGAVGLPVFSGMRGGMSVLLGVTGGYIIGFIFVPLIIKLVRTKPFIRMFAALLAVYLFGTVWYIAVAGGGIISALTTCVFPFIIPDLIKIYISLQISKITERN